MWKIIFEYRYLQKKKPYVDKEFLFYNSATKIVIPLGTWVKDQNRQLTEIIIQIANK